MRADCRASFHWSGVRFRNAVVTRLSDIAATVQLIHAAQIVEAERRKPLHEQNIPEQAKAAEEFISRISQEMGLKTVKYIYGKPEMPKEPGSRRTMGSGTCRCAWRRGRFRNSKPGSS